MPVSPSQPHRRQRTPHGLALPDTSHLAPEDAALVEDLYIERNAVSRGEASRVRVDVAAYGAAA